MQHGDGSGLLAGLLAWHYNDVTPVGLGLDMHAACLGRERERELGLDGPIRANRFADSRESPDSRESFQGSQTEPLLLRIALSGG